MFAIKEFLIIFVLIEIYFYNIKLYDFNLKKNKLRPFTDWMKSMILSVYFTS